MVAAASCALSFNSSAIEALASLWSAVWDAGALDAESEGGLDHVLVLGVVLREAGADVHLVYCCHLRVGWVVWCAGDSQCTDQHSQCTDQYSQCTDQYSQCTDQHTTSQHTTPQHTSPIMTLVTTLPPIIPQPFHQAECDSHLQIGSQRSNSGSRCYKGSRIS